MSASTRLGFLLVQQVQISERGLKGHLHDKIFTFLRCVGAVVVLTVDEIVNMAGFVHTLLQLLLHGTCYSLFSLIRLLQDFRDICFWICLKSA